MSGLIIVTPASIVLQSGTNTSITLILSTGSTDIKFTDLTDVPQSYEGEGGNAVVVKADESGLEFVPATGTGDMTKAVYDPSGINKSAFDVDNHISGTVNKVYTTTEQTKLSGIDAGAEVNVQADWNAVSGDAFINNKPSIPTQYTDAMADARVVAGITGKVDKETGKGLSTNDYTTAEQSKLSGIASGANNYIHPNHSGDVTSVGDGAQTIANGAVTLAKQANLAQNTIIGRISSGAGVPEVLTGANVRSITGTVPVLYGTGDAPSATGLVDGTLYFKHS